VNAFVHEIEKERDEGSINTESVEEKE